MSQWITVAKKGDISEGATRVFTIKGREIAVSCVKGKFYAFLNQCTHMELPLDEGKIEGTVIECPHHGARFDLETGEVVQMPAAVSLEMYPVKVEGDSLKIEFRG